ncbi:calcitonin gene-related peptide type 1 receptor-like isoform X2 [Ruditapes philippinarum]|uniref:calcitonin gene-related peptide type 1 receptor-like isoform X2 n=1 Tax=Ruditapes philippinarum TaxID=129788 RepID=UPI00295B9C0D|nr:calcitonin gene-related peptide type 1 receptor-like isoform X2 [Ruditapes philippinarum]
MQCWDYTKAGETVFQLCPAYITLSNPLAYSKKTCNSDGTWFRHPDTGRVWTNYTMCYDHSLVENHKRVLYMYYYGFSISIVLLIISLIIFSLFRQLKCTRVTLHKHLFSSYIITGGLWIMYYAMVPMNSDVLLHNPIWCQILHVLTHYFTVCNYAWMFCEGFYLHALIVIAFTKDKRLLVLCYLIGWVFPILPTVIYTVIRALDTDDNVRCWTGDSSLHWILAGPINASLIVNFIFSINIMRILLSKLRSVHTNETMQTRRAVRATLILIPLLGLQYIAFPFKPPPGSDGEYVYSMISAFLVSFQGVFVSVMFCFFNGEVVRNFKKKWHRYRMTRSKKYRDSMTGFKQNGESRSMLRSMTSDADTKMTVHSVTTNNNTV